MPIKFLTAEEEYQKNKDLKKEDVIALLKWVEKQQHLPKISEFQAILFLQSCYFRAEAAKVAIENYYTVRSHCPEVFINRNLENLKTTFNTLCITPLPKTTPEGYKIMYTKLIDPNPDNYDYVQTCTYFDMVTNLSFAEIGTAEGQVLVCDAQHGSFAHVMKLNISVARKFMFYLQEALPVRLKAVHVINAMPFVEKFINMVRHFVRKDVLDLLHIHWKMDTFYKMIPKEVLPNELGGTAGTLKDLQDEVIKNLMDNEEFFKSEEKFVVDESKRIGKSKVLEDIGSGIEGTFKKLDID